MHPTLIHAAAIPGGTHSNSRLRGGYPVVAAEAQGSRVTDEAGRHYLDFIMGNGAVVLGHAAPEVVAAVSECAERGLTTGVESVYAIRAAELLERLVPEPGLVRFASTGTEAVLHALDIARAATGRHLLAKSEGGYHGWAAPLNVSTWPSPEEWGAANRPNPVPGSDGLEDGYRDVLVFPFNDLEATEHLLRERGSQLAAVIVEPTLIDIGFVPAHREFLLGLRRITLELGALLIFDETLTGFRIAPGGARELYQVSPDLTVYGKAIANGFPLSAVEGRAELMELTNPLSGGEVGFVGTYNGHAVSAAAAVASLSVLSGGVAWRRLDELTKELSEGVERIAADSRAPITFAGGGGHFQIYFAEPPITDYRSAYRTDRALYHEFLEACDRASILYPSAPLGHAALAVSHETEDLERLLEALDEAVRARGRQ